jgi:hypothetical protein
MLGLLGLLLILFLFLQVQLQLLMLSHLQQLRWCRLPGTSTLRNMRLTLGSRRRSVRVGGDPARSGAIRGDIRDPPRSGAIASDLRATPGDPPRSDAVPAIRSEASPVLRTLEEFALAVQL